MATRSNVITNALTSLTGFTQWYPGWGNVSVGTGGFQNPGGAVTGVSWTGTGSPAGDDQYCKVTVNGGGWFGTSYRRGVAVRMQGSDGTRTCYWFRVWFDAATNRTAEIGKTVNGTETQLASTTIAIADSGDNIAIEAEGTSLRAYHNDVLVSALSVTDSAITGGTWGLVGQDNNAGTFVSADMDAGDLVGAATLEQEGFRWGNDDGSESAHTWAAAQDANITAPAGPLLLALNVNATGSPGAKAFKLQYRKVGDSTWRDVPLDS